MRLSGRNDTVRDTGSGRSRRRPATENQVSYTDLDDEWEASEKKVRDVSRSQNPEEYRVRYSETEEYDSSSNTDARRYGGGVSKDRSYENSYIENMEDTWVYNRERVNPAGRSYEGSSANAEGGKCYTESYERSGSAAGGSYSGRYTESVDGSRSSYTGRYEEEFEDGRGYRSRYEYDEYEEDGRDSGCRDGRKNVDSSRTSAPSGSRAKTKVKKVKKVKKVVAKDGKGITGKVSSAASRGISSVLRFATALVMLLLTMRLAVAFMTGYPLLGSIGTMFAEKNWGLMLYLAGAACLVLLGFVSAFWSLSRRSAASDDRIRSYDTGRGLFAFLFFLIICMAAGLETFLPEGGTLISALQSFLQTLSGAYSKVLPLSVAGIVLCVIRKVLKS